MTEALRPIPIEYDPQIQEVEASTAEVPLSLTLLELVEAVSEVSDTEQEVLATVTYMLRSGRIQLAGSFRDTPAQQFWA